jgi:hypothetical protein
MAEVIFRGPGGLEPAAYVLSIARQVQPTQADVLYGIERQKERILDRTAQGVDVDGAPFVAYSQNGPYYYYPNGRVGRNKFESRQNKQAVNRLIRKIGHVESYLSELSPRKLRSMGLNPEAGGDTSAKKTRSGEGIRFDSYAAFKASLGRAGVDLLGPRAPHMLQAMEIRVNWPEVELGFYSDDAASKAEGHNEGANKLPRRHFFAASAADLTAIENDIGARIDARMRLLQIN